MSTAKIREIFLFSLDKILCMFCIGMIFEYYGWYTDVKNSIFRIWCNLYCFDIFNTKTHYTGLSFKYLSCVCTEEKEHNSQTIMEFIFLYSMMTFFFFCQLILFERKLVDYK